MKGGDQILEIIIWNQYQSISIKYIFRNWQAKVSNGDWDIRAGITIKKSLGLE